MDPSSGVHFLQQDLGAWRLPNSYLIGSLLCSLLPGVVSVSPSDRMGKLSAEMWFSRYLRILELKSCP
jgi:hypothetical protein